MNYLPDKLVSLRKHYNYSQKYIAKVLDIDIVDYMGFENGRSVLNHNQIIKLAKFYHINYSELFINDSNVTLYKVDKQDTDKINIEYFIPKNTLLNRIKKFIKNNKMFVGIGIGAIAVGVASFIISSLFKTPIQNEIHDINTLSVSNRTVLYLNSNGVAKGSGDNSFSQLSNLPTENVVKVLANDEYSVFLLNDGSLYVCGSLDDEIKNDLLKNNEVIDIAAGDNHFVLLNSDGSVTCIGDNDKKQCEISGTQKVAKIFAGKNGSVAITEDGKVTSSGDFVGRSSISDINNIQDIDFSNNSLIYLKEDGTVDYNDNTNNKYYIESLKWENIIDVACGDNFLVGLKDDGTIVVASEDTYLKENIENLKGIIAIDAADKYFIAYDGNNIYGFGENRYNQFISSPTANTKLPNVTNISLNTSKGLVILSFDQVDNATGYEITFGNIKNTYSNNTNIELDASNLENNSHNIIVIKALGDEYYKDSDEIVYEFDYHYEEEKAQESKPETKAEVKEETLVIANDISQMSKDEFEEYLASIGITSIEAIESDMTCSSDRITISDIEGIRPGGTYKKNDLPGIHVKYHYCKIDTGETSEEDLESQE